MVKLEDIIIITSLVYKNQSIISFARSMEINWSVRYIMKEGGNVKYVVAMAGLENIHTVTMSVYNNQNIISTARHIMQ